jgi:hypothetical protein
LDSGQGGKTLVIELLVGGLIAGYDSQKVVRVAEQSLGLYDLGDLFNVPFERSDGFPVLVAHRDEDQRLEGQAQGCGVESCVVAGDCARTLQFMEATVAGRGAQTHPAGEFGKSLTPVTLKLRKDLPVYLIHEENSSTDVRLSEKSWKHLLP